MASRAILVNLYSIGRNNAAESHGILCIGSYLRSCGYDVKIISPCEKNVSVEEICNEIIEYKPDFLGLSFLMDICMKEALLISDYVKTKCKSIFIAVGGQSPTCAVIQNDEFYNELVKKVDCVIMGEGEYITANIIRCLENKDDYKKIQGIAFYNKEEQRVQINFPVGCIEDLNEMPFELRDSYLELREKYGEQIPAGIIGSRGCYHNRCTFCTLAAYHKYLGVTVRRKDAKTIINEINYLHQKYNASTFVFEDDCFCSDNDFIIEFTSKIKQLPYKIKFDIQCRVVDIIEEKILALKECGLRSIFLGLESFCDDALKFYGKGYKSEDAVRCLDILKKHGYSCEVGSEYRVYVGYILWQPYTTLNHIEMCLRYVKKYKITPKTLMKKLMIFNNSMLGTWAKRKGYKKCLPDNLYEWEYNDKRMEKMEKDICGFINRVMESRDTLRAFEKKNGIMDNAEVRKMVDNLCIEYVEEYLNCEKWGVPFKYDDFERKYEKLKAIIESQCATLAGVIFRK